MSDMESFKFPSSVKQIGSIDDDVKIYVEDFAHTYMYQYAKSESCKEKVGVLIGKYIEAEGKTVILISGLIQGKYSENINGNETFTDETWEYIKTRKERYFKGFQIVGWLHTQSGSGVSISEDDRLFHEEYFIESYQVLFLMDSVERMDTFFVWDNEQENLRELNGYFIYYDRNDNMQEYMIDNKLVKSRNYDYKDGIEEAETKEDVIAGYRKHDRIRKEELHQKKVVNMLVGTSGVVVVLCFLMGLLLVQNSERMNRMEAELVNVNDVYNKLTSKIIPSDDATAVVFASQDEPVTEKQSEPSSEEEIKVTMTEAVTQPTTIAETPVATKEVTTEAPTSETTTTVTHVVQEGDSLSWISKHYYGTNKMINEIMEYNDIKDPDKVIIGMSLKLPPK